MADIVIKLPDNLLKGMKIENGSMACQRILDAVYDGVPLPKGHGDLKDAEKLKNAFITWSMAVQGNFTDADIASIICNSPTIIEADKEQE